ncbi:hypothetical protein BY996DRAFT_7424374, partial [Phakopsora pachyrhizi]
FILVRTIGCEASYVVTWTSVFFFIIWAPIFGTITAVYTGKACTSHYIPICYQS